MVVAEMEGGLIKWLIQCMPEASLVVAAAEGAPARIRSRGGGASRILLVRSTVRLTVGVIVRRDSAEGGGEYDAAIRVIVRRDSARVEESMMEVSDRILRRARAH